MDAPYGQLIEAEPGVARLLAPNPTPYTFTGTQVHLVGRDELAVIDPGPADAAHIDALVRAIGGRPVAAILVTHTHKDHSPGARPLSATTGAPVVGCAPLVIEGGTEAGFDHLYAPDRVLADGESVVVDSRTLTAVHTPGHTSNHLCFADEAAGILFSGDHVMGWSTSVVIPPDGDMGDYVRSLEKLRGRTQDRIYYPAHGEPVAEPQRLVRGMIGHRLQRERQILRRVEAGDRTVERIVAAAYPGLDPRLVPAAGASVLAHLLELAKRGLVSHADEQWSATA
ncbi:MBL fold metallo-hydrolase [Sphingomonas sp. BN140010]|uniref:MBL fold metallo-hydrolase n=1 Tax=Sphingomonas arvum TaxID=2992113 RepID=A0ABT3JGX5_9SPHN|nr:MBL fold metallo-hydrolase [Sphingomonas sp. BN140010]MCW3798241.1 MBL fold metallo-hydrolase [Sphingomonas sp. BN140010]